MRITGMATGLDMDEIIKNSMKPYRIKVDQMTQKKDIVEIRQKLYRDIIKENRDFFDKHLDIAKSDSLLKASNWSSISFSSSDESTVTAKASGEAIKENYEVSVEQLAAKASAVLKKDFIKEGGSFTVDTVEIKDITKAEAADPKLLIDRVNKQLSEKNIKVHYSEISNGLIFESKSIGEDIGNKKNQFNITAKDGSKSDISFGLDSQGKQINSITASGKNLKVKINGTEFTDSSNTITKDGITFTFNKTTTSNVTITGKTDVKELKDKIVSFVNDYNKLIEKLNSTVNSKHDRSYNPLTAEQKKEMSESDVKLWNERVEKGQLYRDSDITRIANSMKDSMRTFMESSGLNLKEIGIEPVKDYSGNLNGTFTIDESKLTEALENNTEEVMKLFITPSPTETDLNGKTLSEQQKMKSQTGILFKLKNIIDDEFKKSTSSPLLKKAGFDGTTTFSNNELSKSITDYEKRIKDMEKNFSRREQQLYSKYATLEKMMNKLNSQQSNLMSQLGLG